MTAQESGAVHDTPFSIVRNGAWGRSWAVQRRPSHASANSPPPELLEPRPGPTARHASADTHETSLSKLPVRPGKMASCVLSLAQLLPFQPRASGGPEAPPPTAAHALGDAHDTPKTSPFGRGGGNPWRTQLEPFQLSAEYPDTATQKVTEGHDTPSRSSPGALWSVQRKPSHRSTRLPKLDGCLYQPPTAVQAVAVAQDTAFKLLCAPRGKGIGWALQALPSQRSTPGHDPPQPVSPRAMQNEDQAQDTAVNPSPGAGSNVQLDPFQRSVSVEYPPLPFSNFPTAKQSEADAHDTPSSSARAGRSAAVDVFSRTRR